MSSPDDGLQGLFERHRDQLTHRPPPGLEARIVRGLAFAPAPAAGQGRSWGAVAAVVGTVAVVAFVLGKWTGSEHEREALAQEVLAGHVRSLMVDHLADVSSSEQHTVKPWFEGKLDFAPTVRDLSPEGFVLVGARLDYLAGRPVAALVYRANQHVINLFQWPSPDERPRDPRLLSGRGFQVFAWQRESMTYWAVSDLNAIELQRFAVLWTR